MISRAAPLLLVLSLLLSACGYHMVGHGGGDGAVPGDVKSVSIVAQGEDVQVIQMLRQRLTSEQYALVDPAQAGDGEDHATLIVNVLPVSFVPSAYDAAGIATQYRMTFNGSLRLQRAGEVRWQSGNFYQQGDVYVSGGPANIDAARERLLEDLRKAWVSDALGRLRSGF